MMTSTLPDRGRADKTTVAIRECLEQHGYTVHRIIGSPKGYICWKNGDVIYWTLYERMTPERRRRKEAISQRGGRFLVAPTCVEDVLAFLGQAAV